MAAIVPEIQQLLDAPDACMAASGGIVKDVPRVTVTRVPPSLARGKKWLLRRTNYNRAAPQWRDAFRRSAPMRAFRNGLRFEAARIPTPRVLAAGIARTLHFPVRGYLLMEEIPTALTLLEYFKSHGCIPAIAIRRVAEAVAAMHTRGFVHGDLTLRNVLLDDRLRPSLIDLERARRVIGRVTWRASVNDFFRFARYVIALGPRAHRAGLRLVKYYCQQRGWSGRERDFANAVMTRLKQKVKDLGPR